MSLLRNYDLRRKVLKLKKDRRDMFTTTEIGREINRDSTYFHRNEDIAYELHCQGFQKENYVWVLPIQESGVRTLLLSVLSLILLAFMCFFMFSFK